METTLHSEEEKQKGPLDTSLASYTEQGLGGDMTGEIQWKLWSEGVSQTVGCKVPQLVTSNQLIQHWLTATTTKNT